jgi:hypothetical protein
MSKRNTRPRTRSAPVAVRKSFPWGTVVGAGALVLLLVGILGYAVVNAGSAAPSPLRDADAAVEGITVADEAPSQDHKAGPQEYDQSPSWGGPHNGVWSSCAGVVYDEPIPQENATHSLEHGAAWVTYQPDVEQEEVDSLRELVEGTDYRMLSPFEDQDSPIKVQAWGRSVSADSADAPRIEEFLEQFTNGPQAPEKGATCSGGTTGTGTTPIDRPDGA